MSERVFRLIQGIYLLLFLFLEQAAFVHALIAIMAFEGITNIRMPRLFSRLRYGSGVVYETLNREHARLPIDSEQMQRLAMAIFLVFTFVLYPDVAWYGPWFLGVLLVMAGVTNICPMVIFMRWIGCK